MHSFMIVKSKGRETRNKPSIKHVTKRKLTFEEEQDSGEEGNGCTNEDGSKSQGGIKYFTSWEPILSANNFARNSVSQTQQKTSKIAVIWVYLPLTRNF